VALIASLPESKVDFVAVDMPLANRFTIHILAAVAEYEARLISERSRAAMAADKARGRQFGNPDPRTHRFSPAARKAGVRAIREKAKARALNCLPLLCELRDRGETIHGIALELSAMGIETPRRQMIWRDRMVARIFEYAGERKRRARASRRTREVRLSQRLDLQTVFANPTTDELPSFQA
jgi:resolvase-like protein